MNVYAQQTIVERTIGVAVLVFVLIAPQLVSGFWMDTVLTQTFILGIGAASLVFLSAYGGMISLAQAGLMGIAGYALGNMVTERVEGGEPRVERGLQAALRYLVGGHALSLASILRAALRPGAPLTPPPGCAPAPHSQRPSSGSAYCAAPFSGRTNRNWSSV